VSAARRLAFARGWRKSVRVSVPVIVVGNISVGGTGKTPLVIWLAAALRAHGWNPGIVSRGYRGSARMPQQALPDSDPHTVGDEAVLLARRCNCRVWIGADRVAAGRALLQAHPDCNLLICDDGLQHYALGRDFELAVIDGARGFGNGMLLPAGPLREPRRRLDRVNAVVINGATLFARESLPYEVPAFDMELAGSTFYNLLNPGDKAAPERFARERVHAVAAIGNPQRFFEHLRDLGLSFAAHPFEDHHAFAAADLAFAGDDAVIMTEKDAVKCERFRSGNLWALQVDAVMEPALESLILGKIGKELLPHGR
jgi:tetraacyldisaccharide 4'-kinase